MEDTEIILTAEEMWTRIQENETRQIKLGTDIKRLSEEAKEAMQAMQRIRVYRRHKMTLVFFIGFLTGLIALTLSR